MQTCIRCELANVLVCVVVKNRGTLQWCAWQALTDATCDALCSGQASQKKIKQKPTVLRWTIRLMAIYVVFSLCVSFMRSVECRTELNEQYRPKPTNRPNEQTFNGKCLMKMKMFRRNEEKKNSTMSIRINYQCFLPCLSFIRPFIPLSYLPNFLLLWFFPPKLFNNRRLKCLILLWLVERVELSWVPFP